MKNLKLKMKIIEIFEYQVRLAQEPGETERWVSDIVTGRRKSLSDEDKALIAGALKTDVAAIFPEAEAS